MTQLQIVNLALSHLGMLAITQAQLTANVHPSAVSANNFWEPCRDEVLGEAPWSFASCTLAMSTLAVTDVEWQYVYSWPTMCVGSVWSVFDEGSYLEKSDNEFEVRYVPSQSNKCIFTNLLDAYAEFTYKVTDPEIWSDKFAMAFSYKLASSMNMSLSGDANKSLKLLDIYNVILSEAKRIGATEKVKKPFRKSGYIDAR